MFDIFSPRSGARGSAPPRRVAAAYGVAYVSAKWLREIKSLSVADRLYLFPAAALTVQPSAGAAGDALPAAGAKIWGILERKSQLSIKY